MSNCAVLQQRDAVGILLCCWKHPETDNQRLRSLTISGSHKKRLPGMRYLGWSKISHPLWSKSYTPLSPLRLVAQFHICRYKFVQVHNDFDIMCMAWLTCVLMVLFLSSYSPMVPLVRFKVSAEELECFETLAELQHSERMLGWGWHQQPHHVQTTSLWTLRETTDLWFELSPYGPSGTETFRTVSWRLEKSCDSECSMMLSWQIWLQQMDDNGERCSKQTKR